VGSSPKDVGDRKVFFEYVSLMRGNFALKREDVNGPEYLRLLQRKVDEKGFKMEL